MRETQAAEERRRAREPEADACRVEERPDRKGLAPVVGLLLLSALWALGWLLPGLWPHSGRIMVSLPIGQSILYLAFAVLASLFAVLRRRQFPRGQRAWVCASTGVGFFVIPTIAASLAQRWISSLDEIAILCLTAVFAVALEPYLQNGPPRGPRAALAGALAATAGILCLFPLETPASPGAWVALCGLALTAFELAATNCFAVRLARSLPPGSSFTMAAVAGAASALFFAVIAIVSGNHAWDESGLPVYVLRSFTVDLPSLFLLFWLLRELAASRMTARFLLAPWFAAVGGLALLERLPPLRGLFGLLLLAGGAGWLVFAPPAAEAEDLLSIQPRS